MTYSEIISDNCSHHSSVSWWPKFAFHFTDVTNAVNIISSGFLYSRIDATNHNVMMNDNASRQVIDMTNSNVVSLVRFNFRPLTPTQYYNEGYKHMSIRYDGDPNANIPVPIFFLFDLDKILSLPCVKYSEKTQAGHGTTLQSGIENFSKLNFDAIYSSAYEELDETKAYRHAEIVLSESIEIAPFLNTILCRTNTERTTLLNILKEKDNLAYLKYRDRIKVYRKDSFENNGLSIFDCLFHDNKISIIFSDSYAQKSYAYKMMERLKIDRLEPIDVKIEIDWLNSRNHISHLEIKSLVNYLHPGPINITHLPRYPKANEIGVKIYLDNKLVCYVKHSLDSIELIK